MVRNTEKLMDLGLAGRTVLATGASRGIGRVIAQRYAAEGARVAITYAGNEQAAADVVAAIKRIGGEAEAFQLDLYDRASISAAVEAAADRFAGLDVLVANAVAWPYQAAGPLADVDAAAWEAAVGANLFGTAATVRAAMPYLADGGGRIVLLSSGVSRHGFAGATAYATAKAGLEGLMVALKWEAGAAGVLVNIVSPGFTVTEENLRRFADTDREPVRQRTPSGRLSVPDDIASAVLSLGSFANTNVTGVYLPVAGGTD
jgi:NAD(P)-dependent dehydrogenase (short-subunit alcohol dehydrogenase family)